MALLFFFAAIAAGVWAVVAALAGGALMCSALGVSAIIAGALSAAHVRECLRVANLASREMDWEAAHE